MPPRNGSSRFLQQFPAHLKFYSLCIAACMCRYRWVYSILHPNLRTTACHFTDLISSMGMVYSSTLFIHYVKPHCSWACDYQWCLCSECGRRSWALCSSVRYLQRIHCWSGTGWWHPWCCCWTTSLCTNDGQQWRRCLVDGGPRHKLCYWQCHHLQLIKKLR